MNPIPVVPIGLILGWGLALGLAGCGDAPSSKEAKVYRQNMDLPKTDPNMKKSKGAIAAKTVPEISQSSIEFNLSDEEIQKELKAHPVSDKASCLEQVEPLAKAKNTVQRDGGMWGRIEQTIDLRKFSPIGMQLDQKVNKMIHGLRHLCETAQGQPLDDLARFVNKNLDEIGEEGFRKKMKKLGKAPGDTDIYIKYGRFAKKARDRVLDYDSLHKSILWGKLYIDHYVNLAGKMARRDHLDQAMPDVAALNDSLEKFLAGDTNMHVALAEDFQMPYQNLQDGDM